MFQTKATWNLSETSHPRRGSSRKYTPDGAWQCGKAAQHCLASLRVQTGKDAAPASHRVGTQHNTTQGRSPTTASPELNHKTNKLTEKPQKSYLEQRRAPEGASDTTSPPPTCESRTSGPDPLWPPPRPEAGGTATAEPARGAPRQPPRLDRGRSGECGAASLSPRRRDGAGSGPGSAGPGPGSAGQDAAAPAAASALVTPVRGSGRAARAAPPGGEEWARRARGTAAAPKVTSAFSSDVTAEDWGGFGLLGGKWVHRRNANKPGA